MGGGEPAAEFGKVGDFEGHFGDRVVHVGVESGGDEDEFGSEGEDFGPRATEGGEVFFAGCVGRDAVVAAVAGGDFAGMGIGGILVGGDEEKIFLVVEDVFGAVAVVGVEIPDGDPADAALAGGEGGDGDLVEVAKSHRLRGQRVVPGRAHQGESFLFFVERGFHRGNRGTDGATGVLINAVEVRCVVVEVVGVLETFEMFG